MSDRNLLLILVLLLFILNHVNMSTSPAPWLFEEQERRIGVSPYEEINPPLEDDFVKQVIVDDSPTGCLCDYTLFVRSVIEIRHAPIYLLQTTFRC